MTLTVTHHYPAPDLTWICGGCATVLPAALACRTCTPDGLAVVGCNTCDWYDTRADRYEALERAEGEHFARSGHAGYWRVIGAVSG